MRVRVSIPRILGDYGLRATGDDEEPGRTLMGGRRGIAWTFIIIKPVPTSFFMFFFSPLFFAVSFLIITASDTGPLSLHVIGIGAGGWASPFSPPLPPAPIFSSLFVLLRFFGRICMALFIYMYVCMYVLEQNTQTDMGTWEIIGSGYYFLRGMGKRYIYIYIYIFHLATLIVFVF